MTIVSRTAERILLRHSSRLALEHGRSSITTIAATNGLLSKRTFPSHSVGFNLVHSMTFSSYSDDSDDEDGQSQKTALVIGSSGCLGRTLCRHLANDLNVQVLGADVVELPDDTDFMLDGFVSIPNLRKKPDLAEITMALTEGVSLSLGEGDQLDLIVCASGGWEGDPEPPKPGASDRDVIVGAKAYGETIDRMIHMNLYPAVAAGYAAHRFMADQGLFVVIGAAAALSSTPGMLGYGLSKVGAHHFVQTLGDTTGKAVTTKSKRKVTKRLRKHGEYLDTMSAVGILPTVIDTPSNRDNMPDADFQKWTKPHDIAKEIGTWLMKPPLRPHSGSLIKVTPAFGANSSASFNLAR